VARRSASPSTRTTPPSWTEPAKASDIEGRVKEIRSQIEKTTSDYDKEKLQERLAKLVGGVAINQGWRGHRDRAEGEEGSR